MHLVAVASHAQLAAGARSCPGVRDGRGRPQATKLACTAAWSASAASIAAASSATGSGWADGRPPRSAGRATGCRNGPFAHFRLARQGEQERLVGRPAVDHHQRLRQRRASAGSAPPPCPCPHAMILAIIESNSAAMSSPSATPVSTRIPGPDGSRSADTRPGVGAKSCSGSSALSRASIAYPRDGGRGRRQPAAARDVQLQLDQVDAGCHLGDRMLDLQPVY